MPYFENISHAQMDVLKEIGNIGAGNAATALSKLLNKKIDMKVPDVKIESFNNIMENIGGHERVVASIFLRVEGDAPGSIFFILPLEQAEYYIQTATSDTNFSFSKPPYAELSLSFLQELGNILSGSYLSALADLTNLDLYPSVPALGIDMIGAVLTYGLIEISRESDSAIVIDTVLTDDIKNKSDSVRGHFFFLPDPGSSETIFRSLGVLKDDNGGNS
ncbi:MAG: chemotaxis protein CheY [Bacillales bacterium]|jgi:chemotaxis protein CheC|nr:chemotaxis protein CheY [Bacillales bacterium]